MHETIYISNRSNHAGLLYQPKRSAITARSSLSSSSVALIFARAKSLSSKPCTISPATLDRRCEWERRTSTPHRSHSCRPNRRQPRKKSPAGRGTLHADDVVERGIGRRRGRRQAASVDDGRAPLLDDLDEFLAQPSVMTYDVGRWTPRNARVLGILGYCVHCGCPNRPYWVTAETLAPAFWQGWAWARFWSSRVIAWKRRGGYQPYSRGSWQSSH